jgi:hypothetical protein
MTIGVGSKAQFFTTTSSQKKEWVDVVAVESDNNYVWVMTKGGFWVSDTHRLMKVQLDLNCDISPYFRWV